MPVNYSSCDIMISSLRHTPKMIMVEGGGKGRTDGEVQRTGDHGALSCSSLSLSLSLSLSPEIIIAVHQFDNQQIRTSRWCDSLLNFVLFMLFTT